MSTDSEEIRITPVGRQTGAAAVKKTGRKQRVGKKAA
jgi:hypothetical protein